MSKQPDAVFFDLDGTLCETSHDLVDALNVTLIHYGYKTVTAEFIAPVISIGTSSILKRGANITESNPNFSSMKQDFLHAYQITQFEKTVLFPGMQQVLNYLEKNNIIWGIITNKPYWLSEQIINKLNLNPACLIGGDTLPTRKPDPLPLIHACTITHTRPWRSIYVGDAENDIICARAAGLKSIAVSYGYHSHGSNPQEWRATASVNHADEIILTLETINS